MTAAEPEICIDHLLGMRDDHVVPLPAELCIGAQRAHPVILEPLTRLAAAARGAGFDLRVVSAFRDFDRQRRIWNGKAVGERPVLDADEQPLDISRLDAEARCAAILRWSALPGLSRHHWGTDLDVIDAAGLEDGQTPRLEVSETLPGAPFHAFHRWLDAQLSADTSEGFYRPYDGVSCAVSAEPWHLSFAPLASSFERRLLSDVRLRAILASQGIALWESLEPLLDDILARFVRVRARSPVEPIRVASA